MREAPDFTYAAVGRITDYSGGIPRLVNIVGDHCLLFGYADQKRRIDRQTVAQAIDYLEGGTRPPRKVSGLRGLKARLFSRWGVGAS